MRQILEDYSLPFEASSQEGINKKNLRKVQQSYAACMNEQAIEEEGIEPLSQLVHELHSYFEPVGHDVALPRHHISQDLNSVAPNQLTKALSFLYKLQIHAMFRIDVVVSCDLCPGQEDLSIHHRPLTNQEVKRQSHIITIPRYLFSVQHYMMTGHQYRIIKTKAL